MLTVNILHSFVCRFREVGMDNNNRVGTIVTKTWNFFRQVTDQHIKRQRMLRQGVVSRVVQHSYMNDKLP